MPQERKKIKRYYLYKNQKGLKINQRTSAIDKQVVATNPREKNTTVIIDNSQLRKSKRMVE
jgi:hypothetical protein